MLKRLFLLLALAAVLLAGYRFARRALASDEQQIAWVLDEMCAGFAATRMNPVLSGLATDWSDETLGADRELVRAGLAQLFLEQRGSGASGFPYRVEWRGTRGPTVDESGQEKSAELELELEFFRREGEVERSLWRTSVDAQLRKRDGEWRFVRTSTHTLEGRMIR